MVLIHFFWFDPNSENGKHDAAGVHNNILLLFQLYLLYHMFLPWRDYSFLFDEDDEALKDQLNSEVESVTGIQFIETGQETFSEEMHYFDNLAPSDDIPNHLLLLYLNTGLFLMITGILMIVKDQSLSVFCGCLVFFGSLNIIAQASLIML